MGEDDWRGSASAEAISEIVVTQEGEIPKKQTGRSGCGQPHGYIQTLTPHRGLCTSVRKDGKSWKVW